MRFTLALLTAIGSSVLLYIIAHAEDRGVVDRPPLTVEQAITIGNGLSQLDGYDDCRDGEKGKDCHHLYKFGGALRVTIALNLAEYRRIATAYTAARQALIVQLSNGAPQVPADKIAEFNAEDRKALDAPSDVRYGRIKRDDLKLDDNPIPATVLSLILPVID